MTEISTNCCVVGGGPAGMMLGLLLARAGVDVTVLEKHGDFLRDFRGDTVHPSTLELMYELNVLDEFLSRPHQKATELSAIVGDQQVTVADFSRIGTHCKFLAVMPQWHFLDFLAEQARKYSTFTLKMNTAATALIKDGERITGVKARSADGEEITIRADLVVGADGRASTIRDQSGLQVNDVGAPMDVLWLRLTRKPSDPPQTLGRILPGLVFIMINRGDYWQCGYVIAKGDADRLRAGSLDDFRQRIVEAASFTADRVDELQTWDDVKLLTVKVDWLSKWYQSGLLCIGDAAHAMSPVGGVGINLAIQDAVATANILWKPLAEGHVTEEDLAQVQSRRTYPTRMTQRLQVAVQNAVIKPTLESETIKDLPLPLKLLRAIPAMRGIPAKLIGVGFRPEHVRSPEARGALIAAAESTKTPV